MTQGKGASPHTVIIATTRLAELAEFYRAGLELDPPKPTGDDHLGFDTETVYLGFDRVQNGPATYPGAVSLWFEVDDLDAAFRRFVRLGAAVRHPPTRKPWGATLAAVLDPDGNVVGLAQREAAAS